MTENDTRKTGQEGECLGNRAIERTVTTRREKELACPPAFTTELRGGVQLQGQKHVPELP